MFQTNRDHILSCTAKWRTGLTVFDTDHRQNRSQIVTNKSQPHFIVLCQEEDWFSRRFRHRPPPKQVADCSKQIATTFYCALPIGRVVSKVFSTQTTAKTGRRLLQRNSDHILSCLAKYKTGFAGVFLRDHRQNRSQIVPNISRPHFIVHCHGLAGVFDAKSFKGVVSKVFSTQTTAKTGRRLFQTYRDHILSCLRGVSVTDHILSCLAKRRSGFKGVFDTDHRQNRSQIIPNKSRPHFIVPCQVEDWFSRRIPHRPPPKQVAD